MFDLSLTLSEFTIKIFLVWTFTPTAGYFHLTAELQTRNLWFRYLQISGYLNWQYPCQYKWQSLSCLSGKVPPLPFLCQKASSPLRKSTKRFLPIWRTIKVKDKISFDASDLILPLAKAFLCRYRRESVHEVYCCNATVAMVTINRRHKNGPSMCW